MIIKICGITCLDDALAACEAGADMLGFNFHPPSPRAIGRDACARMIKALRERGTQVTMVGIFVNRRPTEIAAIMESCDLDLAQLSGDEPPGDLLNLAGRAFKALRVQGATAALDLADAYAGRVSPPEILMDAAADDGRFGGAGRTGDWSAARAVAGRHSILLAGGLRPDNVAAAIAAVKPWGVDVASGVEQCPGRKDVSLMRAFVRSAHGR